VALVLLAVVIILAVVGIHSCQVSQRNSSLKNYNNNVSALVQDSNQTGKNFFQVLSAGAGGGNATSLQQQIDEARLSADDELGRAKKINVPDQMKGAQQNLLLTLQMRRDGIGNIAHSIQPALSSSTNRDAINQIAAEMARLYASDVVYKDYTTTQIASALHSAGIEVGGASGEQINGGQFVPDIRWVTPAFVASELHVTVPTPGGKPAPGLHGHQLNSVSVAGTSLSTASTNTIAASPPPTFTLSFANTGQNTENNVVCKVSVSGTSVSGRTVVPQTTQGESTTCQVTLNASPAKGSATVTATIQPVPGEKNTSNNTQTFPVSFQ
jgi:hypothetical protein